MLDGNAVTDIIINEMPQGGKRRESSLGTDFQYGGNSRV